MKPPYKKRNSAGVTLMELLVAVLLLSLLSVGMVLTLRVALSAMTKTDSKLMANRRVVSVEHILNEEISGMIPATADCVSRRTQGRPPDVVPRRGSIHAAGVHLFTARGSARRTDDPGVPGHPREEQRRRAAGSERTGVHGSARRRCALYRHGPRSSYRPSSSSFSYPFRLDQIRLCCPTAWRIATSPFAIPALSATHCGWITG